MWVYRVRLFVRAVDSDFRSGLLSERSTDEANRLKEFFLMPIKIIPIGYQNHSDKIAESFCQQSFI